MARGVNKVILVGNLGKDPEVKATAAGSSIATFSVATSESWKDKVTGQPVERTEWHNIVVYNRLAEIVGQYLKKGSKVYIEGQLRTDKYQDKATGQDRYSTKIVANEMQMLDSRGTGGGANSGGDYNQSQGYSSQGGASQAAPSRNAPAHQSEPAGGFESFDDDIPF